MQLSPWFSAPILAAALVAPANTNEAHPRSGSSQASQKATDSVERLNHDLELTDTQRTQIDPIIRAHLASIKAIRRDPSLRREEKRSQIRENLLALKSELTQYLTDAQDRKIDTVLGLHARKNFFPDVGVQYEAFFPTGGEARSIFGDSSSSFGIGIGTSSGEIGDRIRTGFTASTFSVDHDGNKLFALAPQVFAEYRVPIMRGIFAFGSLSLGPAYMDYSFDNPEGNHFGAKRLGAVGDAQIGLRYGQLRLSVEYHAFTQPAGFDFGGIQASLTWIAIRL